MWWNCPTAWISIVTQHIYSTFKHIYSIFTTNYPGRRCLRYGLNEDFIGQNSKLDVHQKFFQNPKIYIWNMQKIEEKKFFTPGTPPVPGVKVFFKKNSKCPISGVSGPFLMILESKWGFLRPRNWLVIVSRALHVSYTCQARVTCF